MNQESSLPKLFNQLKQWWQSVSSSGFGSRSNSRRLSTSSTLKSHTPISAPSTLNGSVNSRASRITPLSFSEKVIDFARVRKCTDEPPVFQGVLETSYEVDLYVPDARHSNGDDDQNAFLLFCHVQPSAVDVTFLWSKDGSEIVPQSRVVSQQTATQLRINFPQCSDSGKYTCEAINPSGRCETSTHIQVRPKTGNEQNKSLHSHAVTASSIKLPDCKHKRHRTADEEEALPDSQKGIGDCSGVGFRSTEIIEGMQTIVMPHYKSACENEREDVKTLPEWDQTEPTDSIALLVLAEESFVNTQKHIRPCETVIRSSELNPASSLQPDSTLGVAAVRTSKRKSSYPMSVIDSRIGRVTSPLTLENNNYQPQKEKSNGSDLRALKMRPIKREDDPTRWTVRELRDIYEAKGNQTRGGFTHYLSHSGRWRNVSGSAPNTLKPLRGPKDEVGQKPSEAWIQERESEPNGATDGRSQDISVSIGMHAQVHTSIHRIQADETVGRETDSVNGSGLVSTNHRQQFVKSHSQLYREHAETLESTPSQIRQLSVLSAEHRLNGIHQDGSTMNEGNDGVGNDEILQPTSSSTGVTRRDRASERNLINASDKLREAKITDKHLTETGTTNDANTLRSRTPHQTMKSASGDINTQEIEPTVDQRSLSSNHKGDNSHPKLVADINNQLLPKEWPSRPIEKCLLAMGTTMKANGILDHVDDKKWLVRHVHRLPVEHFQTYSKNRQSDTVNAADEKWSSDTQCIDCDKTTEEPRDKLGTNANKTGSISNERPLGLKPNPAVTSRHQKDVTWSRAFESVRQIRAEFSEAQLGQRPIIQEHLLNPIQSKGIDASCAERRQTTVEKLVTMTNNTPSINSETGLLTHSSLGEVPREASSAFAESVLPNSTQTRMPEFSSETACINKLASKRKEVNSTEDSVNVKTMRDVDPNQHFLPMSPLGEGQFGKVHACVCRKTGANYALKKFRFARLARHQGELMEVAVLRALGKHPQIAHLVAAFEFNGYCTLITELVTGGALFERIEAEGCLDEAITVQIIKQLLKGLEHLKNCKVLHCDLKPENLIMCKPRGYQLKIIDFGLACFYDTSQPRRRPAGTLTYLAPETQNYDPQSYATDLWSVAVIAYEILAGITPFEVPHEGDPERKLSKNEISINITKVRYTLEESGIVDASAEAKDFIKKILVRQPEKRPSVEECLKHAWMTMSDVARPTVTRNLSLYRRSTRRNINRGEKTPGRTHSLNKSETDR
ncbi:unnamed protein product [Dicrocoelium dendriticum]|nr:unnamed protein product [Dicrocoelium dendriticum]